MEALKTAILSAPCEGALSVDDNESRSLNVFPNPVQDEVAVTASNMGTVNIRAFSMDGNQVYSNTLEGQDKIDVSAWSSGVYLLELRNRDGHIETRKIVKQ